MNDLDRPAAHLNLIGGELCIDFVNTVSARGDGDEESLAEYADLLAWSRHTGILADVVAAHLGAEAARQPEQAAGVLAQARLLRETLYRVLAAKIADEAPAPDDLAELNDALVHALTHLQLAADSAGYRWTWESVPDALDQMLWPIAHSAAELLTSGELAHVRRCAGDHCGWLFVDRSKNHSRRWCDMGDCGNVAKVRRYRRRQQAAG